MVAGSSSQYSIKSLEDRSALLPIETNVETPSPSERAVCKIAMPSAPDCEEMAIEPLGGRVGVKVALIAPCSWLTSTPRQFGPTMRAP